MVRQATPLSDYQLIVENNIFRPLGWEKSKPMPILPVVRRRTEIRRERPAPTYALTLTGIAKKGGEQVALIEDSQEKDGYFLRHGEQLKDCIVNAIEGEQIILARVGSRSNRPKAGSEIKLALGEEIRYNTSEHILSDSTSASRLAVRSKHSANDKSSVQNGENPSVSEDERLSIIERLKLRRKEQLNK